MNLNQSITLNAKKSSCFAKYNNFNSKFNRLNSINNRLNCSDISNICKRK